MAKKADFSDPVHRVCSRASDIELQMKKLIVFPLICAFFLAAGCSGPAAESRTTFVMDTFFTQTFADEGGVMEENDRIVSDIEKEMSKTIEGSDIYNLNREGTWTPGTDTADVLQTALAVANETDGAFDPALGPLIDLWGIGSEDEKVPAQSEIEALLPLADWREIQIDADGTVRLPAGGSVDLGGIAKGYALDRVAENLRAQGVSSALVDLGGSIAVLGEKEDGARYKIGIRDPLGEAGDYIATVELKDVFTSTSGIYERYFIQDGVRYHHILDRETGRPAESGLFACMIVSPSGILSDAYSTALFVMGAKDGLAFANKNGIDALFVTDGKKIEMTDGFSEKYSFELTADGYEVD
jgi:thiamine biosynthesis lipoprotein